MNKTKRKYSKKHYIEYIEYLISEYVVSLESILDRLKKEDLTDSLEGEVLIDLMLVCESISSSYDVVWVYDFMSSEKCEEKLSSLLDEV